MRKAAYQKSAKGSSVSSGYQIPAPTGGLNKRDSIASMDELDALLMDNAFPETSDVLIRRGHARYVTGLTDQVESLMPYNKPDGTQTLFGAEGTDFFDLSSAGAVGAAVVSSLTNARWNHENFTNSSGTTYLMCFNGVDAPQYWDDSTWKAITGVSSPAITGVTTTDLINITVHKRRVYLVEKDTLYAWYLPVDSVGGEAKKLDLGGIANKGGYLMAIGTWTIDSGSGIDDYWVAITSEGQMIAYRGTDPSSSSTWAHVGTWDVGEPIGRRCMKKYQGDLLVITTEGVVSTAKVIGAGEIGDSGKKTDKISQDYTKLANLHSTKFGWELLHYPKSDMLLLNIPVKEGSSQIQYAMNTNTEAWGGPFTGLSANCWAIYNEEPFFGSNTYSAQFWTALTDNGKNIQFDIQQAFSDLGSPGILKKVNLMKPLIKADSSFSIKIGVNADYSTAALPGAVSIAVPPVPLWGTATWGNFKYYGTLVLFNKWYSAKSVGMTHGIRIKGAVANNEVRYMATDMAFERGGILG